MKRLLVVVDMQNDFISGALGTKEATLIIPAVEEAVTQAKAQGVTVVFTKDTHFDNYMDTQEGKKLPVAHCIKGTEGFEICKELLCHAADKKIFEKGTFGSTELMEYVKKEGFEEITLCGLCTDICVISNAMLVKAALPEACVKVLAKACAGVTPESHKNALSAMAMCQIEIVE